jgi:hypothetical protein
MYQIKTFTDNFSSTTSINLIGTNLWIPIAPDNTDYQQFKIDLANGAQLSDANNIIMTANQISAFISTLP